MPDVQLSELDSLKLVYQQIVEGCSIADAGFYVKHLCELEHIEVNRQKLAFKTHYVKLGMPTEQERLKLLRDDKEWGDEQENDILAYRQTISDNERLLATVIVQQQPAIRAALEEHKASLMRLLIEKRHKIGNTADELAERDTQNFLGYMTIHKDRACTQRVFDSWETFEALDDAESQKYLDGIDKAIETMTHMNIQRVGCMPFFLNVFSFSKDRLDTFLNKPLAYLTNYQLSLFSLGTRNLNILSQAEGSPPEYFDGVKIDEIVQWYDTQYSIIIGKRKQATSQA